MNDELNWPINAPAETETFNDNMLLGGYNPDASVPGKKQRNFTLLQIRQFFFPALEELSFTDPINSFFAEIGGRKVSDDSILLNVTFPEIPKQGTGITIDNPANIRVNDGTGLQAITLVAPTYANFIIEGRRVSFTINEIGAFAPIGANSPASVRAVAAGFKLTIT